MTEPGLEPRRSADQQILSLLRLPIPPFCHFNLSHNVKELSQKRKSPDDSRKNYPEVFLYLVFSYTTVHGRLTYPYSKSSSSRRSASSNAAICNLFMFIVMMYLFVCYLSVIYLSVQAMPFLIYLAVCPTRTFLFIIVFLSQNCICPEA